MAGHGFKGQYLQAVVVRMEE